MNAYDVRKLLDNLDTARIYAGAGINMNYTKAVELLNQDVEKEERHKMAEKAVHNNLYNKGFRDGLAILDKIRIEIKKEIDRDDHADEYCDGYYDGMRNALAIIDKYKAESEMEK